MDFQFTRGTCKFADRDDNATVVPPLSAGATSQTAFRVSWCTISSELTFHFGPADKLKTRWGINPNVSSLFDPLGLVVPLSLPAKQLLQRLCKCGEDWNQPLNEPDVVAWVG